jgi:hypothetical protein
LSLFGCWRFATAQLAPHGPYARLLLFKSHPSFQRSLARASRRRPVSGPLGGAPRRASNAVRAGEDIRGERGVNPAARNSCRDSNVRA